jgi:hypothetical protein
MTYTKEQLDIELLKQKNDSFSQSLIEIKSELRSQFHLVVGLILGIYGIMAATALAKLGGLV